MSTARPRLRAWVHRDLLDPQVPLAAGLRRLILLAQEEGDHGVAELTRRELYGRWPSEQWPFYRRVTAPLYGEAVGAVQPVIREVARTELPAAHQDRVVRLGDELCLHPSDATDGRRADLLCCIPGGQCRHCALVS